MKKSLTLLALVSATFFGASCQNYGPNANRGAAIGAGAGAVGGAIIGNQSGRALEGAAIGAGVGAVGGGAIGHAQDQNNARRQQGY